MKKKTTVKNRKEKTTVSKEVPVFSNNEKKEEKQKSPLAQALMGIYKKDK